MIEGLEKLLAQGNDSPELRFGLGNAYLQNGNGQQAIIHFRHCLNTKPDYSAAWKLLGKALQLNDDIDQAVAVWRQGIEVAVKQGDIQAEKEMRVFLKRHSS